MYLKISVSIEMIQDLLVRHQFSLVPDNQTNVNVEACFMSVFFEKNIIKPIKQQLALSNYNEIEIYLLHNFPSPTQ
jgi:hypothetical protein